MDRVGPLVCPVVVGRDDLLALAERRLGEAGGGHGRLLFLAGEAGIGKTRLLGSIEQQALGRGFRSVRGGTYPGDLEVAGAVFLDLARALRRVAATAPLGARLARRLAEPVADGASGDAHRRRRILTLDVAELLAELVAEGPTIVALEDLHQADDLTLEILAVLARELPALPLLIVGTYRSDELYPRVPMRDWRARLLTQRLAEEARLGRLSLDHTATMTALLLASELPVARDVAEAIQRRADGIPLHVEELVALLLASGALSGSGLVADGVPDTLERAIVERIALRSRRAQEVARVGAVIGRSFEYDLLATLVGRDPSRLDPALEELADHFVLGSSDPSGRYGFRHALICDAIYAQISLPERRRIHARVADAARARGDFSDAFLSSHYERAGRSREAFDSAIRAGRHAVEISAGREAFDLYARAIRNRPGDLSPIESASLLEAYAAAASAVDDNATAVEAYEQARVAWLAAGRPAEAAATVAPLVGLRHLLGDDLTARAARLEAALDELETPAGNGPEGPAGDTPVASPASAASAASGADAGRARARILAALAAAYMLDRRLDESLAYGERARTDAAAVGDASTERNAAITVGACLVFAGRMDEGWRVLEEGIARSRSAGLEAEAARGYRMIGSCASVLVEYDRGERWLREGIDYAERVELWNHRHYMASHLAHVLWATGRWSEAESVAEHVLADGRGGLTTRITALHVLGYVALGRGETRAKAFLDEARVLGEEMAELQRLSPAIWGLAEAALLDGDAATSIELSERGLAASRAVADTAYLYPYLVTGTRARLAVGDPAGASRWVGSVSADLRHRDIPGTRPALDHAAGLVLLAQGATGQARIALSAAVAGWHELRRTWEELWARLDLATCLARANRPADAVSELEGLVDRARTLGSPPLVTRATDLLRTVRARHPTDEPWEPLTAREFEVARLVGAGLTNAQIADELGVARKTVSAHVEHILAKLGVGRRTEVATWVASLAQETGAGAGPGAGAGR